MNLDPRAEAWATLQVSGISPRPLLSLLRAFGSPEAVLAATPSQRRGAVDAPAGRSLDPHPEPGTLRRTLAWLATPDASLVALDDADYPAALLETADPPPVKLMEPPATMVGARSITIVLVGVLLVMMPSLTVQLTVRVRLAPPFVGSDAVDLYATESSTCL